jgi:alpha,alpha-trehalase
MNHQTEKLTRRRRTLISQALLLAAVVVGIGARSPAGGQATKANRLGVQPILDYISQAWATLTRSMTDCESIVDPKIKVAAVLYLPAGMAEPSAVRKLAADCSVEVKHLPVAIHRLGEIDTGKIQPNGLLYLPEKYVVPGGRFNEMYGWDSYFIIRGLLRAGRIDLAKGMVDNFLFEIENYGAMLNANRTYYLTRSQPPFVSSMVVDVYDALRKSGRTEREWSERAYADLEKDYAMWTREPHLAGDTGLSRYYDFGEGPPVEAAQDEAGSYRKIATYFFFHPAEADDYVVRNSSENGTSPSDALSATGKSFSLRVCDHSLKSDPGSCEPVQEFQLSSEFYKGDRSMRESGFDVTFRFAPFGAATHHFAPVCLNSLLYKNEKDLEQISRWLGRSSDAARWAKRAEERKKSISRYLWDEKAGMFFDFDFRTEQRSAYRFATSFYPLWAGLATPEQAKAVAKNVSTFERPGGLAMSATDSGAQWDLPYGWGNIQMLAVEGLRRYGFDADADRISYEFLSMVAQNFRHDGTLREKYNVVTRSAEGHAELGYHMNVVGFGWTNAAFLELLDGLPANLRECLEREQEQPLPAESRSIESGPLQHSAQN